MDTKTLTVLGVVASFMAVAIGVAGMLTLPDDFPDKLDYESESQFRDMFAGLEAVEVRGVFPSVEEPSSNNELFDAKIFTMSYTSDGLSQKIIIQGKMKDPAYGFYGDPLFRFCFEVKTASGVKLQADITQGEGKGMKKGEKTTRGEWYNVVGFQSMEGLDANGCFGFSEANAVSAGASIPSSPYVTYIHGAGVPHGSILRVTVKHWGATHVWESWRWEWGARDEALLLTGLGYLTKDREGNYEVGETAHITVTIPYLNTLSGDATDGEGGFGFYVEAYHMGLGKHVTDSSGQEMARVPVTNLKQTFKIPIKTEYFVAGSMKNQIEFYLYNELYPKDAAATDVVDIREKAPPIPKVSTEKDEYNEGDTITIEWECLPNTKTNASIVQALVVAWISGVEVYRDTFPGSNDKGSGSFIAPMSGILDFRVSCIDSQGRGSGNDEMVVIHNVLQTDFCTVNPTHPACIPPDAVFPLWEFIMVILALLGAVFLTAAIGVWVLPNFGLEGKMSGIISLMIFFILFAIIVVAGQDAFNRIGEWMAYNAAQLIRMVVL